MWIRRGRLMLRTRSRCFKDEEVRWLADEVGGLEEY